MDFTQSVMADPEMQIIMRMIIEATNACFNQYRNAMDCLDSGYNAVVQDRQTDRQTDRKTER